MAEMQTTGDILRRYKDLAERKKAEAEERKRAGIEETGKKYECETCHDQQYLALIDGELVPMDDIRAIDPSKQPYSVRECECLTQKRVEKLFSSSKITEGFRKCGFRNFNLQGRPVAVRDAYETAVEYQRDFETIQAARANSLGLVGRAGSGKTHLCMAVCNYLMMRGVSCLYFPWVEGCDDLRSDFNKMDEKLDAMKYVDVLYVDDLFKGKNDPSDFEFKKMFGVLNFRYLNYMPVLISSELDIETIRSIDDAFGSRVYDMTKNYLCNLQLTDEEKARGVEINYRML